MQQRTGVALIISMAAGTFIAVDSPFMDVTAVSCGLRF